MGYHLTCTLIIDGQKLAGTAVLEQHELIFRGDAAQTPDPPIARPRERPNRLAIPLKAIEKVHVRQGSLCVSFSGRQAVFELGAANAGKWARRIASPPSRADKLGIKPGLRVAIVNLPDATLPDEVESRGATIVRGPRSQGLDLIFFGAARDTDLERLPALAARMTPSGSLWLVRTKGPGATISEAASMGAGKRAGLVDVKVVSFSETQSAEKYVIPIAKRPAR